MATEAVMYYHSIECFSMIKASIE
ncbi:protein of unknown function (plasmid) [Cupriavidus taiwanensis]|nr:protein of unknown function [Cupriavidus taiwanensis]SOZ43708.1 protein of unknown function [Cupriavidus taiwanensis]SPD54459.1 protein of unknown function [Cupriavidus taiwanensis]